jgi:ElaB/YqjD/DUF883 family membrane-anchored ribosome-binding protein
MTEIQTILSEALKNSRERESEYLDIIEKQSKKMKELSDSYIKELSKVTTDYQVHITILQKEHETNITSILNQIKQVLDLDITSGTTGESYHEQLQSLKNQVWGLQQGQKELRTSLHNIITKMFP